MDNLYLEAYQECTLIQHLAEAKLMNSKFHY
jgi:hypothetical protein